MKIPTLACSLLLGLALACSSGPGPEADHGKSPAEIQSAAAELETPALESVVESYKSTITDLDGRREELEKSVGDFVSKLGEKGLSALTGDKGAADELTGDANSLKEELADVGKDLEDLESKLKIYADELKSRSDA